MSAAAAPMTVKLTRGNAKGQWEAYRSSDTGPFVVFIRCAWCSQLASLSGVTVKANGMTSAPVLCAQPGCRMETWLFLEGWLFNRVDHPSAFALCQADGDGQ